MKLRVFLVFISVSVLFAVTANAKCKLIPENVNFKSTSFIKEHDKLVEKEITKYYEVEYYEYKKHFKSAQRIHDQIKDLEDDIKKLEKKIARARKDKDKAKKAEELQYEIDALAFQNELFKKSVGQLKALMESLTDPLIISFDIEEAEVTQNFKLIGHFTIEAFLSPKPDTEIILPMGGLAFHMMENSVVYVCLNFDKYKVENNYLSMRFLKTNRKYPKDAKDYLLDPYSFLTQIRGYLSKPKVSIDPSNVSTRPAQSTFQPIGELFANVAPLRFIQGALGSLSEVIDGALDELTMDLAGVGVKSLTLTHDKLRIQFGVRTLFGAVKMNNLYEYDYDGDYASVLNRFTINPYGEYIKQASIPVE